MPTPKPISPEAALLSLVTQTFANGGLTVSGLRRFLELNGHQELLEEVDYQLKGEAPELQAADDTVQEPLLVVPDPPPDKTAAGYKVHTAEDWWEVGDWVLGVPFGRTVELEGVQGIAGEQGRVVYTYWGKPKADEQGAPLVERVAIVRYERVSPGARYKPLRPIASETLDKTLRDMGVKPTLRMVPER